MSDIQRPRRDGFLDFVLFAQLVISAICLLLKCFGYSFTSLFATTLVAINVGLLYRQVKSAYLNNSLKYITGVQEKLDWDKQVVFITGGVFTS